VEALVPADTFPRWLSAAINGFASGNVDAWADIFADDAVHEFPFAAPDEPQRLEGKEAIRRFMADLAGQIRFGAFSDIRVREAGDEVVIEAEGHHWDLATGDPFDLRYVWIITRRDGRVTRLRDYMGSRRPRNKES
jgi:ketosteroid isomerase-like protein